MSYYARWPHVCRSLASLIPASPAYQLALLALQLLSAPLGILVALGGTSPAEPSGVNVVSWLIAVTLLGEVTRRLLIGMLAPLPLALNQAEDHVITVQLGPLMMAVWCASRSLRGLLSVLGPIWSFGDSAADSIFWRILYALHSILCALGGLVQLSKGSWLKVDALVKTPSLLPAGDSSTREAEDAIPGVYVAASTVAGGGRGLFAARSFSAAERIIPIHGIFVAEDAVSGHPHSEKVCDYGIDATSSSGISGLLVPLDKDFDRVEQIWGFANEPPMSFAHAWPSRVSELADEWGGLGQCLLIPYLEDIHVHTNAQFHVDFASAASSATSGRPEGDFGLCLCASRALVQDEEIFVGYGTQYRRQYPVSKGVLRMALQLNMQMFQALVARFYRRRGSSKNRGD
ncbi:unnamed protein product [Polarella glacialis]|uniref:SET domain-containing protein n=1 Tax=Polarella glacialis TaxID=89957 RepID=A0A813ENH6_POLGL|nr:unnamed protein product [Polarella glacialis]